MNLRFSLAAGMILALASLVGCGPPDYYRVNGTVTKDGSPVPYLQITFQPIPLDRCRPPMTIANEEGFFEMKCGRNYGVPPGTYTVHIEDPAEADGGKTSTEPDYLYVVDRYSPVKSDLLYESDAHRTGWELKLDTSEYTGPKVNKDVIKNTTDDPE